MTVWLTFFDMILIPLSLAVAAVFFVWRRICADVVALVMSASGYTFNDYLKAGAPIRLIMGLIVIFVIPLILSF